MGGVWLSKRVIIVEPDRGVRLQLKRLAEPAAHVTAFSDFIAGRKALLDDAPDLIVTNLRLSAYNGLHLVYLAAVSERRPRTLVYLKNFDRSLIAEAQRAGAFVETFHRVTTVLPAYIGVTLPPHDRRTFREHDRRLQFRGGRRAADLSVFV